MGPPLNIDKAILRELIVSMIHLEEQEIKPKFWTMPGTKKKLKSTTRIVEVFKQWKVTIIQSLQNTHINLHFNLVELTRLNLMKKRNTFTSPNKSPKSLSRIKNWNHSN